MRILVCLLICSSLLCSCGVEKVIDYILDDTQASNAHSQPVIDPNTGEQVQIWIPKEGMIPSKVWESRARVEEEKCSNGYYQGRSASKLFPSQLGVYKNLPNGGRIWAYYYYYGEDTPGFDVTDWYETVFNIYVDKNGRIYECRWRKYYRYTE